KSCIAQKPMLQSRRRCPQIINFLGVGIYRNASREFAPVVVVHDFICLGSKDNQSTDLLLPCIASPLPGKFEQCVQDHERPMPKDAASMSLRQTQDEYRFSANHFRSDLAFAGKKRSQPAAI